MNNSSNWTGRAHRTTQSAFGPYASGPIHDPADPDMDWQDVAVGAACGVALACLVVIMLVFG